MESNWKQHEKNSTHQQPTDEFSAFFGSNTGEQSRPSFHESALRLNTVPKPNRLWERIMLGSNCLLLLLRMTSLISLKWSIAWWCLVYEKQPLEWVISETSWIRKSHDVRILCESMASAVLCEPQTGTSPVQLASRVQRCPFRHLPTRLQMASKDVCNQPNVTK